MNKKFNPRKLQKLNDPQRLSDIPPDYIGGKLAIDKPETLVEIGAGTAFFSIAFLEHFRASKVYACEISEVMIDWVKQHVCVNHPHVIPVKSGEHSVPLDDNIADLVFMINLHHELDDPTKTVAEAHRLLKQGGGIFIVDWKKKDMPEGPPLDIRCLPEQVKGDLMKNGFNDVYIFKQLPKHFLVVGKKSAHDA